MATRTWRRMWRKRVFTDLARKAGSLARRESLTGWLYTSAHFAAAKMVRTENRRRDREEKFMREPIHEMRRAPDAPDWEKIRPALDDVMHELKETDREAFCCAILKTGSLPRSARNSA